MATSAATTVEEYLANLPQGYEETMDFGMVSYVIPLSRVPKTYNGHPLSYAAIANQKNYMSVYLMNVYGHKPTKDWFTAAYKATGKKLDMGECCVRFKKLADLPLDVISQAIARTPAEKYVGIYEKSREMTAAGKRSKASSS